MAVENCGMFLELFTFLVVGALTLSDNVSTKPGLKIFRDEYRSVSAACHDLGIVKKPCKSDTGIQSFIC